MTIWNQFPLCRNRWFQLMECVGTLDNFWKKYYHPQSHPTPHHSIPIIFFCNHRTSFLFNSHSENCQFYKFFIQWTNICAVLIKQLKNVLINGKIDGENFSFFYRNFYVLMLNGDRDGVKSMRWNFLFNGDCSGMVADNRRIIDGV